MADIFQEVEDDLKQENLKKIWKKYGALFGAVSVVVIAATAGWQGWKAYDLSVREEQSAVFYQAAEIFAAGDLQAAGQLLEQVGDAADGYGVLARFTTAQIAADEGRVEEAVALWDQLSAEKLPVEQMSDIAAYLAALHLLEQKDFTGSRERVALLTRAGSALYGHALELQGLIALEEGDKASARQTFEQLAQDAEVSGSLKSRAERILSVIGE
ncbi:tetratricopeptide repeat protein [Kiloniella sp. b19]|uniref:tetratricopeptide repeat protein n=1 Tax=Kiloniella sp. GXU_MW_B19 TaxID=3141326 RepID=UPI0031D2EA1C